MTYDDAVAEARTLIKRTEEDYWRLAELTWQATHDHGKTTRQWADDIGMSQSTVSRWARVWDRHGAESYDSKPIFADAVADLMGLPDRDDHPETLLVDSIRRVLDDPDADVLLNGLTPAERGQMAQLLAGPEPTPLPHSNGHRDTSGILQGIDERRAALDLGAALDHFVRDASDALQRAGDLPEGDKIWLNGSAQRAEIVLASAKRYIERGRTEFDEELRALLQGEA